tara:strand:- start:671 stop:997 length:327 start_codon:yes stop_codon:yes gene_type:complete
MAKFRNITSKGITVGIPSGSRIFINAGATVDLQHDDFIEKARKDNRLKEEKSIGRADHLPEPKTLGKPSRKSNRKPKGKAKKEKVTVQDKVDKALKKPKGLRKPKRAD